MSPAESTFASAERPDEWFDSQQVLGGGSPRISCHNSPPCFKGCPQRLVVRRIDPNSCYRAGAANLNRTMDLGPPNRPGWPDFHGSPYAEESHAPRSVEAAVGGGPLAKHAICSTLRGQSTPQYRTSSIPGDRLLDGTSPTGTEIMWQMSLTWYHSYHDALQAAGGRCYPFHLQKPPAEGQPVGLGEWRIPGRFLACLGDMGRDRGPRSRGSHVSVVQWCTSGTFERREPAGGHQGRYLTNHPMSGATAGPARRAWIDP